MLWCAADMLFRELSPAERASVCMRSEGDAKSGTSSHEHEHAHAHAEGQQLADQARKKRRPH